MLFEFDERRRNGGRQAKPGGASDLIIGPLIWAKM